MNTQTRIALAALAAVAVSAFTSTAAMAQEVTVDTTPFQATTTRAAVRAEVLKARAGGLSPFSTEIDGTVQPVVTAAPSLLTREQVRAEARNQPRNQPRNPPLNPQRADLPYGAA